MSRAQGGAAYRIRRNRAYRRLHSSTATQVTYSIRLTATNAGGSDPEEKTAYITVNRP